MTVSKKAKIDTTAVTRLKLAGKPSSKPSSASSFKPLPVSPVKKIAEPNQVSKPLMIPSTTAVLKSPVKTCSAKGGASPAATSKPSTSGSIVVQKPSAESVEDKPSTSASQPHSQSAPSQKSSQGVPQTLLWVDKYQPKSLDKVVGQHGPASPANKLLKWLQNWHTDRKKHGYKATSAGE